jgi:hypothetical protein
MQAAKHTGWIARLVQVWRKGCSRRPRTGLSLQLLEVLPLGKRQVLLVRCAEEYFLMAGGLETVNVITKVAGPLEQAGEL